MGNLLKRVEELEEDIQKTIEWAGSLHKYLRETRALLKDLQRDPRARSFYRSARRRLRYALRSQAMTARFYGKAKKNMDEIAKQEPKSFGDELAKLQNLLRPHEVVLIKEASFFKGRLNTDFRKLGAAIDLLRQNRAEPEEVQRLLQAFINKISRIIAERGFYTGLMPFIAVLERNAKPYAEELKNQLSKIRKAA